MAAIDIKNDASLGANLSLCACTTTTVTEDLVSANTSYFTNNGSVGTATGIQGTASTFVAASTQSLSVADNADVSPTGNMSIAAWIYLSSAVTGRQVLCGKDASQPNRSYAFNLQESTGDNFEVLLSTNGQNAGTNNYRVNAGMTFSTSAWYHVVMAYNSGAGTVACYVNGSLQATITGASSGIYDSTAAFYIARWQDAGAYFDGRLNQFLLYKKLLDSTDASNLYNGGSGIPYEVSSAIKTVDGLAKASVKTVDGLAIASVKTIDGLA
jgi:hypothetical protein